MKRFFPGEKFKYLLLFFFILSFFSFVKSQSVQIQDSTSVNSNNLTIQVPDSTSVNSKNLTIQVPDSTSVNSKNLTVQVQDSTSVNSKNLNAEEIVLGERLFYGLVHRGARSVNCAACHNTRVSDTLNWNPDANEISVKFLTKSSADLTRVLLKPTGKKMAQVHKDFQLTAEEIVMIKGFMDKLTTIGIKHEKPVISNLLILIITSLIFLVASADLIIRKIFVNQKINLGILLLTSVIIIYILAVNAIAFGRSTGFSPDQPIKFSHTVHAGQNKTDCLYCHYSAKTSKTAGIPSGNICLNCHFLVRTGTRSGVTEINKVLDAYDKKYPVEWIRIYKLPDFVFFSHAQHVNAGEIDCSTCHGTVTEMDRLYQYPDLSMGWCIDCHDTRKVNMDNKYYKTYYPSYYDEIKSGKRDSVMIGSIGGRDCGKCHY
jgi:hypothetical protein